MNKLSSFQKNNELNPVDTYWKPTPSGIRGLSMKVFRRIRNYYWRFFKNRNYIFVHNGPFKPVTDCPYEFANYDRFEDVPGNVKEAILLRGGEKALEKDCFEMNHGAIMWVGFIKGQVVHRIFARRGKHYKQWFVDLDENDIALVRGETFPKYRGLGILSASIQNLMSIMLQDGDKAYVDCNINNKSSIRGLLKIGFVKIAEMRPINRKQALGVDN